MARSIYFTEDHDLFRQTVREFLEREVAPHADEWEETRRIPREIFRRMGELGFLGINFPERYGGTEADMFFTMAFLEELPRSRMGGFCAAVTVQQYMAMQAMFRMGSEALKQRYVVPSIEGRKVGALAISEPDVGSDVASIRTSAVREGDEWVINGAKTWITNGAEGDFYTVAVKTDREAGAAGVSLIVVDADTPGVKVGRRLRKIGWHSSDTAELAFVDVRVPLSNLIGRENQGFYYIMDAFQLERLVAAGLAIGGCLVAIEETLAYMAQRQAFGRPINKFQALRHRLVDLMAEVEAVRQLTYHTAWLHQEGEAAIRESSMAKLLATELSNRVADECLQFFGGFGYVEEYPIARMFRDSRVGTIVGGTSEIMREILAKIEIDGARFDRVEKALEAPEEESPLPTGNGVPAPSSEIPETLEDLMRSLPTRHRPDKTAGWQSRFHFEFKGAVVPAWTVEIDGASVRVAEGLDGAPTCTVRCPAELYLGIELGTQDPQMAFLMGKIKVSNLGEMTKYMKAFRPVRRG